MWFESGAWQEAQPAAPAAGEPADDGVPEDAAPAQSEGVGRFGREIWSNRSDEVTQLQLANGLETPMALKQNHVSAISLAL